MRTEALAPPPRLRLVRAEEVPPAVARARAERSGRRVLKLLTVSVAALTMVGLVMVLSASSVSAYAEYGSSFLFFKRQLLYAGIGTVALVAAARLPHRVWQRAWPALLGISVLLLAMVLHPAAGTTAGGAARWLRLGPFSVQPSELAKFVVVTATASILSANLRHLDAEPLRWMAPVLVIVGTVCLLILLQPDLGTMMVVALTTLVLLFAAGVRFRFLAASALLSGAAGLALILGERYRRARFFSFLHPWSDPHNTGYQIVQSLIALGSGHLVGVGLGASRQKWAYVPNAHTDFIFSIMGEELGLLGELVVLALFAALVYAGIRIALRAPDPFGRLLAAGITGWIGLQALINLGAVTGMLPITGVPLPFVSFGGSSLVVSMASVGVLLSVGRAGLKPRRGGVGGGPGGRAGPRGGAGAESRGRAGSSGAGRTAPGRFGHHPAGRGLRRDD